MHQDRLIQIFEHDELRVDGSTSDVKILERDCALLARLHRQTQGRYYDLTYKGVKFKQYVGVLKVGDLVIEVLPKGDRALKKTLAPQAKLPWRALLVQLLSRIGYIKTELGPRSSVFLQHGSLIDLYVMHFLQSVGDLCRQGLVKTYIPRTKTRDALKGQLQFSRQMLKEARGVVGFDTRAAEYEKDHPLNRLLLTALSIVKESRLSHVTQDLLPEIEGYFEGVSPLSDSAQILKALQFDRRTERYRTAIDIAKPILLSAYPGVRSGIDDTFSMFFDMNRVWERYIFCELKRYAAPKGVKVDRQVSKLFWAGRSVRPDIVVYLEGGRQVVIDTKWKELKSPDPSIEDLNQMFIYNHQVQAAHSILLYPDIHGLEGRGHKFKAPEGLTQHQVTDHGCSVDFARIWREQSGTIVLNRNIGQEVWGMVERGVA
jgi:5-methylcytosine-specific restriction enzyme subunit McrC